MRRIQPVWIAFCFGFLFSTCSQQTTAPPKSAPSEEITAEPEGDPVAIITTDKGDIVVQFLAELAPKTVAQFSKLVEVGFYTRTTFHFVSPSFIWGGDPLSKDNDPQNDGLGNARVWIEGEFHEDYKVDRGAVGMMRKDSDLDSSSCQFFIVLERKSDWDGKYNIFGEVIEGIEVAEAISEVPHVKGDFKFLNRPAARQLIRGIRIEHRKMVSRVE